ncbi:MAG: ribosome biogenesis GTPase Der [Dehalococcoidia bacterium]
MSKPVIAIVGRPNVGKSALFNRLAGQRLAIVEEVPGTTRDRSYADISWDDRDVILIDTGGMELTPDTSIAQRVKEQVDIAIQEADAIIFLTSVKEGVTIPDREIAETLRRSNKPVVLAVNKCDNEERERQAFEFSELPLPQPVAISAYHGTGIADMMESISSLLPYTDAPSPPIPDVTKIAILGRPNVGKSMLLNSLLGQERVLIDEEPGTTRDSIDTIVERDGQKALFIDTAGIRRRGKVTQGVEKYSVMRAVRSIDRADVCLLVMDALELATAQDAHVGGYIRDAYKGTLLVVNKWDLAPQLGLTEEECTDRIRANLRFLHYAPIRFVSAQSGFGIDDILPAAEEINEARKKRIDDNELKQTVADLVENHPPMSKRRFRIRNVIQANTIPPTFVFAVSNPTLVHFSYRRYLENGLRDIFGFTGTPLRLIFKKKLNEK